MVKTIIDVSKNNQTAKGCENESVRCKIKMKLQNIKLKNEIESLK